MLKKHPVLVYTLGRLVLLALSAGALWLLGTRGFLWILLSFVVAALLSYVLLRNLREDVGRSFGGVFSRINQRIEQSKVAEDDLIESAQREASERGGPISGGAVVGPDATAAGSPAASSHGTATRTSGDARGPASADGDADGGAEPEDQQRAAGGPQDGNQLRTTRAPGDLSQSPDGDG